jgi:hypothetical protein
MHEIEKRIDEIGQKLALQITEEAKEGTKRLLQFDT